MKKRFCVAAGLVCLVMPAASAAGEGFYIGGDAGPKFVGEPLLLRDTVAVVEGKFGDYNVGGFGGYRWKNFRLEAEVTLTDKELDSILRQTSFSLGSDADVNALSMMGNVYYDFENRSKLTPYVFGGLGTVHFEAENARLLNNGGLSVDLQEATDTVFGYQAGAGFSYNFNDDAALDLGYKFFVTEDPDFSGLGADYDSHNVSVGLRFSF